MIFWRIFFRSMAVSGFRLHARVELKYRQPCRSSPGNVFPLRFGRTLHGEILARGTGAFLPRRPLVADLPSRRYSGFSCPKIAQFSEFQREDSLRLITISIRKSNNDPIFTKEGSIQQGHPVRKLIFFAVEEQIQSVLFSR